MIDTLELANKLAAGEVFTRPQAERLASSMATELKATVATRADLETFHWRTIAAIAGLLLVHFIGVWVLLWNLKP